MCYEGSPDWCATNKFSWRDQLQWIGLLFHFLVEGGCLESDSVSTLVAVQPQCMLVTTITNLPKTLSIGTCEAQETGNSPCKIECLTIQVMVGIAKA